MVEQFHMFMRNEGVHMAICNYGRWRHCVGKPSHFTMFIRFNILRITLCPRFQE